MADKQANKQKQARQDAVQELKEQIEIDLSNWTTMRDLKQFTDAERRADLTAMFEQMSKIVVAWPFDGDPSDPDAYLDIPIPHGWSAIKEAVYDGFQDWFL